jgi:cytidyltransferase-like protein
MFKVAYTFGRFNIPHNGHLSLFNMMGDLAEKVVVGVSTGKNNLPVEQRMDVLNAMAPNTLFIPLPTPFFLPKGHFGEDGVIVLGEDQGSLADSLANYYGLETFLHKRITSSTMCRSLFAANNVEELVLHIPTKVLEMCYNLYINETGYQNGH